MRYKINMKSRQDHKELNMKGVQAQVSRGK